jgi:hypothetical protein
MTSAALHALPAFEARRRCRATTAPNRPASTDDDGYTHAARREKAMTPSRPAVIRGTVLSSGGEPLRGARVYFVGGPVPLPDIAALAADDGSFSLTAPAAGDYEIGAAADGFAPSSAGIRVAEAGSADVTLRLEPQ